MALSGLGFSHSQLPSPISSGHLMYMESPPTEDTTLVVGMCARRRSWSMSGVPRQAFWTAAGHSWLARNGPRSALGRHLGVQKPSRARPDASLKRLWALKAAQDRFFEDSGSILARYLSIFERFFVDFRSSRVRRRHKSRISKRSRVILSARLGFCVAHSFRTARTSFELIFEHCMFSLFSLRTHKLT